MSLSLSLSLQPFPHHEFTSEESQMSLHALGLYPSASLVVSKQSVGGASAAMETGPSHLTGSTTFPAPRGSKKVSFGREQMMAASSHTNKTPQGVAACMCKLMYFFMRILCSGHFRFSVCMLKKLIGRSLHVGIGLAKFSVMVTSYMYRHIYMYRYM